MAKRQNSNTNASQDNYTTEKVNVISNCLLGDYINDEYFISDDIVNELVEAGKVKKSIYRNSVFCSAFIAGYGEVVFEVTFQKNTVKNLAMAELFVLENEYKINGYIQNTIRTKISEFVDELDNFIEKAYDFFHISLTENDGRDYNLKEDISLNAYINAKKSFNLNMAKLTSKEYNKLYRNYVTARLEALKGCNNEFSNTVLDKFNGEFAKIEKYFLKENNYKALSELLDKCIEDCTGVNPKLKAQEKEVMEALTPIVGDFSKQADTIYEQAQPRALNNLNKSDREMMGEVISDTQAEMEANATQTVQQQRNSSTLDDTRSRTPSSGTSSRAGSAHRADANKPERGPIVIPPGTLNSGSFNTDPRDIGPSAGGTDGVKPSPSTAERIAEAIKDRTGEGVSFTDYKNDLAGVSELLDPRSNAEKDAEIEKVEKAFNDASIPMNDGKDFMGGSSPSGESNVKIDSSYLITEEEKAEKNNVNVGDDYFSSMG